PLDAGLRPAGRLEIADLILGAAADSRLQPRASVSRGTDVIAIVEIYAKDPAELDDLDVLLELRAESGELIGSRPMSLRVMSPSARAAQTGISTDTLPPGRYTVRSIVRSSGNALGEVGRTIEIRN